MQHQQPEKPQGDAIAVLPPGAAQVVLPDFRIDFQVLDTSSLLRAWVWRQFVIQGQQLTVLDAVTSKLLLTLDTPRLALKPAASREYLLQTQDGKTLLTVLCPSETLLAKFQATLHRSSSTPYWVPPPQDIFQELIDVAKSIVETEHAATAPSVKSSPTIFPVDVATYLSKIKPVYDHVNTCTTKADLVAYLIQLEREYVAHPTTTTNFASLVHRLYPTDLDRSTSDPNWALANTAMTNCPHCNAPLAPETLFDVRVTQATVPCPECGHALSNDALRLGAFRCDHPTFPVTVCNVTNHLPMPPLRHDSSSDMYQADVSRAVFVYEAQTGMPMPKSERKALDATLTSYFQRLDLVAAMARHLVFVSQLGGHFGYWSHPSVIEAAVIRYHRFCRVTRDHPKKALMPTIDIALVRYVHQTISKLAFFVVPSTDTAAAAAYAETFILWAESSHGSAYSSFAPSFAAYTSGGNAMTQSLRKKKWEKWSRLPSRDCRFVGVDEYFVDEYGAIPSATALYPDAEATGDESDETSSVLQVDAHAAEYVAVIGTPLMDDRVVPRREARTLTSGLRIRGSQKKHRAVGVALLMPLAAQAP
ncbi:Aste57867_314 [Aphanomyces stellatus]|uniref:Aste57867_314 protein n=1 Tax=Aphanomyces stellatus TaxID=120398 RepID=A0A485K2A4_9STRA|nr:hypothetical protein As57867_000314 [Aphanomyces stellatus]VFT77540.1 Aste57867_314 [Aphanomyces stellatus]